MNGFLGFVVGVTLGQIYYNYILNKIPFPHWVGIGLSLFISLFLGIGNVVCVQLRCISLLTLPMYFGKPGRSVIKAVVLTYVVAGPISNMCLNAKEVVRVYACNTQLSYNLSKTKYEILSEPLRKMFLGLGKEIAEAKSVFRSFSEVVAPIQTELEGAEDLLDYRKEINHIDEYFEYKNRSNRIDRKYLRSFDHKDKYQKEYLRKMEYRCNVQLSQTVAICMETFSSIYEKCCNTVPFYGGSTILCWPIKLRVICNILYIAEFLCNSEREIDPGLNEGYVTLKKAKQILTKNIDDIKVQYKVTPVRELYDIQDAKETGDRVIHAFQKKNITMQSAIVVVNAFMALIFLRILTTAVNYHELYLTRIGYDNSYITGYFKRIDSRRKDRNKCSLLPLKKMERSRYVDVSSVAYRTDDRHKLLTQVLKVMMEVITATTFVMLDRLFYEALDVVRQNVKNGTTEQENARDVDIQVEGAGVLASIIRRTLDSGLDREHRVTTDQPCLPHPRPMPCFYFVHIYGGYLWILLLLLINPYTMRLKRLICSYFYPRREKQRILHLYNDILKKRLKMRKTLRRKAVQAVRAHYLSGETLLSLRMRLPSVFGWLDVLPAARMTCLICGETEPRSHEQEPLWHTCAMSNCPFVYCQDCWTEVGEQCLACDPSLAELSDVDSLTDEEHPRY